ncbi:MAG: heavy metal translocating P-type ATPase [Anaerolineales bacterium]|nr:heavy metal translocating P-type ATPase [Anaerolineales bacterium]MCB9434869.1 heavy metal translocating P-type ATPase [Ardenticatenaceae bacterium]
MSEQTIQLDIPLLLPDIEDARDDCLTDLEQMLENHRGIHHVHVNHDADPPQLCLHFDPNLISLAAVERIARDAGSSFTQRYRHEAIPFTGMTSADAANSLAGILRDLPGMLHANVNYAAGLAFVAYDTTILQRPLIHRTVQRMGYRPLTPTIQADGEPAEKAEVEEHDHGSAPAFLPHWVQERWTLILVALAGLFFLIGWLGETFFNLPETVALVFFILAYIAGGYDIATHAIPGLLKGKFDTDVLMLAAAAGAALLGEWAEGAFLLFLFSLGHAGEHYALDRARNAINALGELMPKTARVKQGDEIVERPIEQVKIDDIVVVRPGDRIPVDGEIVRGVSAIDQSAITGESMPVNKVEGDEVFAGTINQENALDVKVTKLAQDNTLSRVMQMVAEAQEQQSPTQQLTQRFTAKFVPAVLIFVALVIIVPPLVGWMSWQDSFYRAMLLLVAASPCALAIGTPASVLAGIAQAARNGVLIKGGVHLENLGGLSVMAFDKTGTLTEGKFKVTNIVPLNGTTVDDLLRITAAVEQQSNHPLALAVVRAAQEKALDLPSANGLENVTGRGVKSEVGGKPILIGSLKLFRETNDHAMNNEVVQTVERFENEGKTTMAVSEDGRFLGVLALADTPRSGVRETLQKLLDLGVKKLVMLTGDNDDVAQQIGKEVGVTDVRAELLPEQKLAAIKMLQQEHGDIAMAGDGVNDAPALATATVGIAMGGAGTAVALETADVALMADDLAKLPFAVGLSRATRAIIRQNLVISLGIIGILIVTSVLGVVALSGAVILHEGSTIIVVLNALRLLGYRS